MMKKVWLVWAMSAVLVGCSLPKTPEVSGRRIGERITDISVERQILTHLDNIAGLDVKNHRVGIDVFRGQALLTGEVPSEATKQAIATMAGSIEQVKEVHNYLVVAAPKSQSHTVHEQYLKSKLQAKLLTAGISLSQYDVVVRNDTAYLMGTLNFAQYQKLEQVAKSTDGIMGLVSLASIIASEEEAKVFNQVAVTTGTVLTMPLPQIAPQVASQALPQTVIPQGVPSQNMGFQVPESGYPNTGLTVPVSNVPNYTTPKAPVYSLPTSAVPPSSTAQSPYVKLYQNTNHP